MIDFKIKILKTCLVALEQVSGYLEICGLTGHIDSEYLFLRKTTT